VWLGRCSPVAVPPGRAATASDAPRNAPPNAAQPTAESLANLLHRGSALLRDRDPGAAREVLERALVSFPENTSVRNLLALSLFQIGQLEHALLLYESLHLERPESIAAKVNLALVLLKVGRASAARPLLERVVAASPEHRRAWGYLGVALEQLGLLTDAECAFLAGHYSSAARRLRERHQLATDEVPEVTAERARNAMPRYRRKTLPPDPWGDTAAASSSPALALSALRRFTVTLRPPEFTPEPTERPRTSFDTRRPPPALEREPQGADDTRDIRDEDTEDLRDSGDVDADDSPTTMSDAIAADAGAFSDDAVDEIPFEATLAPPLVPTAAMSAAPKQSRPVVPLLDAALASLLVVPHEASVVVHPTGLVLVGMEAGAEPRDGGFAARLDAMQAVAGSLRLEPMPRRAPIAPEPFRDRAFSRVVGTGQLVLAPSRGGRLMPLEMDADVAFLREDLVVAFDQALLCDLGRIRHAGGAPISLVRFRGDGVIVLQLDDPFLAFDVQGRDGVTLRADSLIGWIGLLAPEPMTATLADGASTPFINFTGEGTVLFRAPHCVQPQDEGKDR
jgi:Flp pilus assembly protein TadD